VIVWLDTSSKARGPDACWGVASLRLPTAGNPQTGQLLHPSPAPPQPPPDPKLLAVQARAQVDAALAAHQAQLLQQKALAGFVQGLDKSGRASTEATAEIISGLKSAGVTSRSVAAFQKFYEGVAREFPSNTSAAHRAALLANILRSFEWQMWPSSIT
jgi:hypothetical protein